MDLVKRFLPLIVVIVIVVVGGVGGYYAYENYLSPQLVSQDKYQAIFLSNGQVYFGKIKNLNKQYAELTSIYYLILKQPLQQQESIEGEETTEQQPEYTLIKLGQELHGPMDKMVINRDHILFVEDLKEDGKVTKAIKDYEGGQ